MYRSVESGMWGGPRWRETGPEMGTLELIGAEHLYNDVMPHVLLRSWFVYRDETLGKHVNCETKLQSMEWVDDDELREGVTCLKTQAAEFYNAGISKSNFPRNKRA
ncbi:hypothetical protein J6590_074754 [Homalodisca vitripennis]|nr:hypothetical protein J6590_074754 [Homalodisca vitripennis]